MIELGPTAVIFLRDECSLSIDPAAYAFDGSAQRCPSLQVALERVVALALPNSEHVQDAELRLVFESAAECDRFCTWFVAGAKAASLAPKGRKRKASSAA